MFLNLVCNLVDIAPTHPHTHGVHTNTHTRTLKCTLTAYLEDGAHFWSTTSNAHTNTHTWLHAYAHAHRHMEAQRGNKGFLNGTFFRRKSAQRYGRPKGSRLKHSTFYTIVFSFIHNSQTHSSSCLIINLLHPINNNQSQPHQIINDLSFAFSPLHSCVLVTVCPRDFDTFKQWW